MNLPQRKQLSVMAGQTDVRITSNDLMFLVDRDHAVPKKFRELWLRELEKLQLKVRTYLIRQLDKAHHCILRAMMNPCEMLKKMLDTAR
jgi:hypothetical protein